MIFKNTFKQINNSKNLFFIIVIIAVAAALFNSPLTVKPLEEPETFRYLGMLIRKGFVPYVDGFDHKSPFIYFVCAFAGLGGIWGLWVFSLGLTILTCYLLLKLVVAYKIKYGFLIPIVFIFLVKFQYDILGRSCDTRDITAHLLIILTALIFLNPLKHFFFKGLLAALIPFTQQTDMLTSGFVMLCYFIYIIINHRSILLKAFVKTALGVVIVCCFFAIYFLWHGAFNNALYFIFTFNTSVFIVKGKTVMQHIISLWELLNSSGLKFAFIFLILFYVTSIIVFKQKLNYFFVFCTLGFLLLSLVCVAFSGNYWHYYIHHFVPPFTILFAMGLYNLTNSKIKIVPYILYPSMVIILFFIIVKRAVVLEMQKTFLATYKVEYKNKYPTWALLIAHLKNTDNTLMIFNNPQSLCVASDFKMKLASKWVLTHFWSTYYNYAKFDSNDSIFKAEYIAPLEKYKTPYLVKYTRPNETAWEIAVIRPSTLEIYNNYLYQNYTLYKKDSVQGWEMYLRNTE